MESFGSDTFIDRLRTEFGKFVASQYPNMLEDCIRQVNNLIYLRTAFGHSEMMATVFVFIVSINIIFLVVRTLKGFLGDFGHNLLTTWLLCVNRFRAPCSTSVGIPRHYSLMLLIAESVLPDCFIVLYVY